MVWTFLAEHNHFFFSIFKSSGLVFIASVVSSTTDVKCRMNDETLSYLKFFL